MKVILSRKGFDDQNGGAPSPIMPDGQLVSLPIPYRHPPMKFSNVRLANGDALGSLVEDLTAGRIQRSHLCHLDPDLRSESLPRSRGWVPALGQVGNAQKHLDRNRVGKSDLFLFFGTFRAVERVGKKWRYCRTAPKVHSLYGWLQIEDVVPVLEASDVIKSRPWLKDHPHAQPNVTWRGENVIYTARANLHLNGRRTSLAGAGTFNTHDELMLTTPGERKPGGKRSQWRVFPWCGRRRNLPFAIESNRKFVVADGVINTNFGNWQELIVDTAEFPEIFEWCRHLIASYGRASF